LPALAGANQAMADDVFPLAADGGELGACFWFISPLF